MDGVAAGAVVIAAVLALGFAGLLAAFFFFLPDFFLAAFFFLPAPLLVAFFLDDFFFLDAFFFFFFLPLAFFFAIAISLMVVAQESPAVQARTIQPPPENASRQRIEFLAANRRARHAHLPLLAARS